MKIRPKLINCSKGFTIVELLITVIIAGILITFAGPGFRSLMEGTKVTTVSSDLHSSLVFARSEAIKREANVVTIPLSADWNNGWEVVLDANNNSSKDSAEQVLLTYNVDNANVSVTANGAVSGGIQYKPSGRSSGDSSASDFFTINGADTTRFVRFSLTGRPYVDD